jgi:hypothetical protein
VRTAAWLGRQKGGLQVEGVGKVLESGHVRVNANVCHAGFNRFDLGQAGLKPYFVTDDARMLGHRVPDGPLQDTDVFLSVGGQEAFNFFGGLSDGLGGASVLLQRRGVVSCRLTHDPPENEKFDEGISAQAVGAVQAGGRSLSRSRTASIRRQSG